MADLASPRNQKNEDGKNVQSDHPVVLEVIETQCGAISSRKMSEKTLQNQGATCQYIFARLLEPLQCTGKPYLLKAQHSAFNIVDSKTIPLTVQNWQITSFVPDSTDLVLDSSNICLAVRTVGMQRCPGFHKNVSFPK